MDKTTQNPDGSDKFVKGIPMEQDDQPTKEGEKSKDEDKKDVPPEKKPDEKSQEKVPGDKKPEEDKDTKKSSRPEKYVPVEKYTSEKKQWRETSEKDKALIKELQSKISSAEADGDDDEVEKLISEYSEKHEVSDEVVKDLLKIFEKRTLKSSKKSSEKAPDEEEDDKNKEDQDKDVMSEKDRLELEEMRAEKRFNTEFTEKAVPAIKDFFPNATPEQIAEAKEEITKLALTKEYLHSDLDVIIYKERKALNSIFATKTRRGTESDTRSPEKRVTLTVEDFKDGNNFKELDSLPVSERNKIIEDFPLPVWNKYKAYRRSIDDGFRMTSDL